VENFAPVVLKNWSLATCGSNTDISRHAVDLGTQSGWHTFFGYSSGGGQSAGQKGSCIAPSRLRRRFSTVTIRSFAQLRHITYDVQIQAGGYCLTSESEFFTINLGVGHFDV
jgi:hypothetical protein